MFDRNVIVQGTEIYYLIDEMLSLFVSLDIELEVKVIFSYLRTSFEFDIIPIQTIELANNRYKPQNTPDALMGSGEFSSYHDKNIEYNSDKFHLISRHGYYACISYIDALFGRIMSTLDELGLRDNTIIVLWGDHGWNLGEHNYWSKHNLLYTSKNAPLIISVPGFKKNIKTDGITELLDIYPTLCELTGIDPPKHLEGKSLVPLMKNPNKLGKKAAFSKWRNGTSVTTTEFSFTKWDNNQKMLFDLKKDPQENENIAENPIYMEKVEELSELIENRIGR